ncbi:MAG: zinc-ribbon domain-containing protein [Pseudomonadota bacterium]
MRLTCPNCGARYEVDDSMIPAEGRDVQCSNCTTTWFQPGVAAPADAIDDASEAPPPEPPVADFMPPEDEVEEASEEAFEADAFSDEDEVVSEEPLSARDAQDQWSGPEDVSEPAPVMNRPELDPETRDVLREEAEREAELRRHEAEVSLQRQGEMALDQIPDEPPATDLDATISDLVSKSNNAAAEEVAREIEAEEVALADRVAETVSESQDLTAEAAAAAAAAAGNSRRDLLPDIEEINSTLRASEERSPGEALSSDIDTIENRPRRRRGLRLGFGLVMLVFAGLILAYTNAPRITQAFPSLLPTMQTYVAQVDRFRLWIDGVAQDALPNDDAADTAATPPAPASTPAAPAAEETAPPAEDEAGEVTPASQDSNGAEDAAAEGDPGTDAALGAESETTDPAPAPLREDQEESEN